MTELNSFLFYIKFKTFIIIINFCLFFPVIKFNSPKQYINYVVFDFSIFFFNKSPIFHITTP